MTAALRAAVLRRAAGPGHLQLIVSTSGSDGWVDLGLRPAPHGTRVLAEMVDGGQAFRWTRVEAPDSDAPVWRGQWLDACIDLRYVGGTVEWRPAAGARPSQGAASLGRKVRAYFDADRDYDVVTDRLPWRSDPHLARCLGEFRGLRILRQPFGETLLGFLCSATKQIVQIKQMMALLAARLGEGGRLPTWERLAAGSEPELRGCLLGFRARHIHRTAEFLAANPAWLDATEAMAQADYPGAKARLCTLPGVGEKIADCVLLFGAGCLQAFPVDVWILKTMARRYGLAGWKPAQVAHFGRVHFGEHAGVAQQYLFAFERGNRPGSETR